MAPSGEGPSPTSQKGRTVDPVTATVKWIKIANENGTRYVYFATGADNLSYFVINSTDAHTWAELLIHKRAALLENGE